MQIPSHIQVILASQSPRRKELLGAMGIPFQVVVSDVDEQYPASMHPHEAVGHLSLRKAEAVRSLVGEDCVIIASDTMVELGGVPFGKPQDEEDAKRMLRTLSGEAHRVHTGVAVLYRGQQKVGVDATEVVFHPLTEETVDWYVGTGEPMDKAGAYGIQGLGGKLVSHITGEMDTVIGLPCKLVAKLLAECGWDE